MNSANEYWHYTMILCKERQNVNLGNIINITDHKSIVPGSENISLLFLTPVQPPWRRCLWVTALRTETRASPARPRLRRRPPKRPSPPRAPPKPRTGAGGGEDPEEQWAGVGWWTWIGNGIGIENGIGNRMGMRLSTWRLCTCVI